MLWGEKGKGEQIWNKPKPTNTNTKSNTNQKTTNHMFYNVRGDFWGMHRIDLVGTLVSLGLSTLDSVAI